MDKPINERIREKIETQLGKLMLSRIEDHENQVELKDEGRRMKDEIEELKARILELESTEPQ